MIAADSSSWIAAFGEEDGGDVRELRQAMTARTLWMIPVVLTELLSGPALMGKAADLLSRTPMLDLLPGYWERTGRLRAQVLRRGRRARLGDALIAQCCLDHGVPLITRDRDFVAFAEAAGLDAKLFGGWK